MARRVKAALSAGALALALVGAGAPARAGAAASPLAARLAAWALASGDNGGRPFAVVDKTAAEVFVFAPDGRLQGAAPALLGLAPGDESPPGIGDRPLSAIGPGERITPAGRFVAGFGPDARRRTVFWVDYATAVSLHPVITGNPKDHRRERLASETPRDNRITYGCINVPPEFYADVVVPTFQGTPGVFYILPEATPLDAVFPAFALQARSADAGAAETADAGSGASGANVLSNAASPGALNATVRAP
jgi:hypothetical protein